MRGGVSAILVEKARNARRIALELGGACVVLANGRVWQAACHCSPADQTRWVAEPWNGKTVEVVSVPCPRWVAGASGDVKERGKTRLGTRHSLLSLLFLRSFPLARHHTVSLSVLRLPRRRSRSSRAFPAGSPRNYELPRARPRARPVSLLPCALICFLTCPTRSSRAPRAALFPLLTPLRPRHLAHRAALCKYALSGMIIDALRWGVRTTALRTLAPGFTLAAWVSFISLQLETWISHSCDPFAHEVSRELLNRHCGHDPDHGPGRLGANNDSFTDRKPGPNGN
jgi:hypothetical protein